VAGKHLRRQLIARDFHEALNYAFVDAAMLAPGICEAARSRWPIRSAPNWR
jgi:hypothetical protein